MVKSKPNILKIEPGHRTDPANPRADLLLIIALRMVFQVDWLGKIEGVP